MTYVDPNGQAATWLKNNPLDALYTGLSGLSFIPGFNIFASIGMMTIDLAKGDYTALAMDSLGVVIPGIGIGTKLGYDGIRAIVDGLKFSDSVANFSVRFSDQVVRVIDNYKSFQNSGNQLALATGFVDNSSSKVVARSVSTSSGSFNKLVSENISSEDDINRLGKTFLRSGKSGKPKYAPVVRKWINNGGKIDIDEEGMWTYVNSKGISVSYPNGEVDFKASGYVDFEYNIGHFENRSIEINHAKNDYPTESIGHTWHHSAQQNGMLQAVPIDIHSEFTHFGGISKFVNN